MTRCRKDGMNAPHGPHGAGLRPGAETVGTVGTRAGWTTLACLAGGLLLQQLRDAPRTTRALMEVLTLAAVLPEP